MGEKKRVGGRRTKEGWSAQFHLRAYRVLLEGFLEEVTRK